MSQDPKVYMFEEVAKHNRKDDCWLIISGKVYDVTPFVDDHPGGDEILLTSTGKDATEDFEDIGHSDDAREIMKSYYIGEVDISTIEVKQKKPTKTQSSKPSQETTTTTTTTQPSQTRGWLLKFLQFLLPLLILGLAFTFKKINKE